MAKRETEYLDPCNHPPPKTLTLSAWEVAALAEALKFALNHGAPINYDSGQNLFRKLDNALYVKVIG